MNLSHISTELEEPEIDEQEIGAESPVINHKKHYKIIFIKAPSQPTVSRKLIQQQIQAVNEEKTLVYVLFKKPDTVHEVRQLVHAAPEVKPQKPEVFFIKYRTEKELPVSPAPIAVLPAPAPTPLRPIVPAPILSTTTSTTPLPIIVADDEEEGYPLPQPRSNLPQLPPLPPLPQLPIKTTAEPPRFPALEEAEREEAQRGSLPEPPATHIAEEDVEISSGSTVSPPPSRYFFTF